MDTQYKNLFTPIKIKNTEVKNRIFMCPMETHLSTDTNEITDELIGYYAARARGGVGLITTGVAIVDEMGKYGSFMNLGIYNDSQIEGWRKLATEVHKYGTKIAPQLFHGSTSAFPMHNDGRQPIGASPVIIPTVDAVPRPLEIDEIHEYAEKFGEAARRAKEAGCDAVELLCAHRHGLLGNFLSPLHNKRVDEYGGSVEGRLKFPLEVIAKIIEKTGPDFPIIVKLSAEDLDVGGQSLFETLYIAKRMEEAGAAMFHFASGTFDSNFEVVMPSGSGKAVRADIVAKIRQTVSIPVGYNGRNNEPWVGEMALALGKTDVVYMGRSLIADPELPNKAMEGKCDEIRPCIACYECTSHLIMGQKVQCTMNPFAGKETIPVTMTEKSKRVLVIGGGPAGLEAGTIAAQRGHDVTLMEKSNRLGGQMYLAGIPRAKQDVACGTRYLIEQAKKSGVKIELGKKVTKELIKEFAPDEVILATGGQPIMPKWLECDNVGIVSAWDVLEGKCDTGKNILVIGGNLVGCETADHLAHPFNDCNVIAKRVTILEMMPNIMMENLAYDRSLLVRRLQDKGVNILTGAKVESVKYAGEATNMFGQKIQLAEVNFEMRGQKETLTGFDTIVAAMGTKAENALEAELKDLGIPVHVIGDANKPRKIINATEEAADIAMTL